MKKIVIEIIGRSGKSFDLTLDVDSWIGLDGDWKTLPGYMPQSKGFFNLNSGYDSLHIWDRERSLWETIEYAVGTSDGETKIYGVLDDFMSTITKKKRGKGHIFKHGKAGANILKTGLGYASSDISWEVKSIV